MKNKYLIIVLLALGILGIGIYFVFKNSGNNVNSNNYTAQREEAYINTSNTDRANTSASNTIANKEQEDENNSNADNSKTSNDRKNKPATSEKEIATYTTKIYSKDSGRQHNVQLTCNTLNDTVVENGATFSFCNTVGQATTAKGYKKAEIFDNKRK